MASMTSVQVTAMMWVHSPEPFASAYKCAGIHAAAGEFVAGVTKFMLIFDTVDDVEPIDDRHQQNRQSWPLLPPSF
jgi:hypothetical protein